MNPEKFESIKENPTGYYKSQYAETQDCIVIDQQIAAIAADLDDIYKRQLKGTASELISPAFIPNPDYPTRSMSKTKINNEAINTALIARNAARNYLQVLLKEKENKSILLDCRNKIETKRADESAGIFSEASAQAEKRILTESKKKQYLMIGLGSVVILTGLIIVLRKR